MRRLLVLGLVALAPFVAPAFLAADQPQDGMLAGALATLQKLAGDPDRLAPALRLALVTALLSLLPALVLVLTSFVRIVVVLTLLRQALGVRQLPPNQVLVALALFLTALVMQPTFERAYAAGLGPYLAGERAEALTRAVKPFREFMLRQTRNEDVRLVQGLSHGEAPALQAARASRAAPSKQATSASKAELSLPVLAPAYLLSELRASFRIGLLLFLPFLLIDLVVAVALLSAGMIVVPPIVISLPIKLAIFVLVDGWTLVIASIAGGIA